MTTRRLCLPCFCTACSSLLCSPCQATLDLSASPLGVMVLSVVTWIIWIDSVICHCPRCPDWRPHKHIAVGMLHGVFFTMMQW
ncbi:hypothetical protein BJV74DRAFT_846053 [Russula compacta]|nr:hypothetical protein BJV74DRAFT_846053 [Russula compacta]